MKVRHAIRLNSRDETSLFGHLLGERLKAGDVVALEGDLGAGKTTLTQGIARGLGISSMVNSPTFSLIQEYPGRIPLFHCDPYRLESPASLYDIGFEEYFERGGVVVVEWANLVQELLPEERLTIRLEHLDTNASEDALSGSDARNLTLESGESQLELCEEVIGAFASAREKRQTDD